MRTDSSKFAIFLGGGEIKVHSNYTDSVLLALRERQREDFDFWAFRRAFHQGHPSTGDSGPQDKMQTTKRRALTRPEITAKPEGQKTLLVRDTVNAAFTVKSRAVTSIPNKERAHYTHFSARNAVRPVLQARPGGIRDSLCHKSGSRRSARLLRFATALAGDSAPSLLRLKAAGMAERFPFGLASTARKSTPRGPFGRIAIYGYRTLSNEIQNHWLICIPPFPRKQPSPSDRPGAVQGTERGEDGSGLIQRRQKGDDGFRARSVSRPLYLRSISWQVDLL